MLDSQYTRHTNSIYGIKQDTSSAILKCSLRSNNVPSKHYLSQQPPMFVMTGWFPKGSLYTMTCIVFQTSKCISVIIVHAYNLNDVYSC